VKTRIDILVSYAWLPPWRLRRKASYRKPGGRGGPKVLFPPARYGSCHRRKRRRSVRTPDLTPGISTDEIARGRRSKRTRIDKTAACRKDSLPATGCATRWPVVLDYSNSGRCSGGMRLHFRGFDIGEGRV